MDSSRTRNVAPSIHSTLLNICQRLELSVSLEEKITLMEDFISTASLVSSPREALGTAAPLTSTAATQILSQATAHLQLAGIMRQRMETSSQEDSSGRAEGTIEFIQLVLSGMRSSWLKLERSFLSYARIWILDHCVSTSHLFERTPIGGIDWTALRIPIQEVYSSAQTKCLLSIDGHMKILVTATEVSFHGGAKGPQRAEQGSAPRGE